MQALTSDPSAFKQNNYQDILFRARKAFETYQNDCEKTYTMPAVYKTVAEFCTRIIQSRTTDAPKGKPTPVESKVKGTTTIVDSGAKHPVSTLFNFANCVSQYIFLARRPLSVRVPFPQLSFTTPMKKL